MLINWNNNPVHTTCIERTVVKLVGKEALIKEREAEKWVLHIHTHLSSYNCYTLLPNCCLFLIGNGNETESKGGTKEKVRRGTGLLVIAIYGACKICL